MKSAGLACGPSFNIPLEGAYNGGVGVGVGLYPGMWGVGGGNGGLQYNRKGFSCYHE